MARNNTGNIFRFAALGVGTILAGGAIGYYVFGGVHSSPPAPDTTAVQEAPVPAGPDVTPPPAPRKTTTARLNSDYTAPNAPRIHIVEDKNPSLADSAARPRGARSGSDGMNTTDIPTPDVEASQQGGSSAGAAPSGHSADNSDSSDSGTPAAPAPAPKVTSPDTESNQTGISPADPAPRSSDTDSHSHTSSTSTPDAEATQTGPGQAAAKTGRKTQYRVQAGSFENAGNAQDYVSTLHNRGVDASLHTEQQGDKTVYKVQVGAYRNRAAADQAAADLRHNGVPVTVSPAGH